MLTREALERFAPRPHDTRKGAIWDGYIGALEQHGEELCAEFGIDEQLELVHCLAQMAHETDGFTILWESGNYSPMRIMEIFGVGRHSAAVTHDEAMKIGQLQGEDRAYALFERVYGLGNPKKAAELGNTEPGDGYRYRGFGFLQTTGRRDHEELLGGQTTPYAALRAAIMEFDKKGCCEAARRDDIKKVTTLVNGGSNGIASRREWLAKAKRVWPTFPGGVPHQAPATEPPAEAAPKSMATSKEGNIQVLNGTLGGGTAIADAQSVVVKVVSKAAETGKPVSLIDIVLAVVSSPLFIIGVTVAAASAASWLFRARKRWHMGV